ncbi:hypothetical protein BHM03_00007748 [Ensete ventricosum]|uniref:Uncharacterized protein n=1 Tax=Ensete ventricosum TaxID=4639 RepID=A0A445MC92_ENSVE|nr:hypothetical protein BHM03_00007748 [Ensete ventricosum]
MHRVDAVGNSLGVRRELTEGIGNLLGWRKGVLQKKIETRWKILQPDNGPRSILGLGLDDAVEPRREFAKRFVEGIGKLAGRTPGDHRKKTR